MLSMRVFVGEKVEIVFVSDSFVTSHSVPHPIPHGASGGWLLGGSGAEERRGMPSGCLSTCCKLFLLVSVFARSLKAGTFLQTISLPTALLLPCHPKRPLRVFCFASVVHGQVAEGR